MKILFIGRAGKDGYVSPILRRQADSLIARGHQVDMYPLKGKGVLSYFTSLPHLLKTIKLGDYEILHAHYSLTAMAVSLLPVRGLVVSLMGSDILNAGYLRRCLIRLFARLRWRVLIVKTEEMQRVLGLDSALVVPNGVDTEMFRPMPCAEARARLNLDGNRPILLFAACPERKEKNFKLAKEVAALLGDEGAVLLVVHDKPMDLMPLYLNASSVVLITSLREGSPNILKEAMACSRPVVTTGVGDAALLISGVDGCAIAPAEPLPFAAAVHDTLTFASGRETTAGRERILEMGLDSASVADRLLGIYQKAAW